jgi:hypothetical protein
MVREQFFMLLVDPEAAVAAIPDLLPKDVEAGRKARSSGQCPDFSACLNVAEFRLSPH